MRLNLGEIFEFFGGHGGCRDSQSGEAPGGIFDKSIDLVSSAGPEHPAAPALGRRAVDTTSVYEVIQAHMNASGGYALPLHPKFADVIGDTVLAAHKEWQARDAENMRRGEVNERLYYELGSKFTDDIEHVSLSELFDGMRLSLVPQRLVRPNYDRLEEALGSQVLVSGQPALLLVGPAELRAHSDRILSYVYKVAPTAGGFGRLIDDQFRGVRRAAGALSDSINLLHTCDDRYRKSYKNDGYERDLIRRQLWGQVSKLNRAVLYYAFTVEFFLAFDALVNYEEAV